jgi:hypothetical protein
MLHWVATCLLASHVQFAVQFIFVVCILSLNSAIVNNSLDGAFDSLGLVGSTCSCFELKYSQLYRRILTVPIQENFFLSHS